MDIVGGLWLACTTSVEIRGRHCLKVRPHEDDQPKMNVVLIEAHQPRSVFHHELTLCRSLQKMMISFQAEEADHPHMGHLLRPTQLINRIN